MNVHSLSVCDKNTKHLRGLEMYMVVKLLKAQEIQLLKIALFYLILELP